MATTTKRTGEKGKRTARSTNPYQVQGSARGATTCIVCGAIYRNKRWYPVEEAGKGEGTGTLTCPACRRISDKNPAGIVTLSGAYLAAHETEINNLIRHAEATTLAKNPLGRIMTTSSEKGAIVISTTESKLAQKIGRDIFRAHGGDLHYRWSHDQDLVRVNWSRE